MTSGRRISRIRQRMHSAHPPHRWVLTVEFRKQSSKLMHSPASTGSLYDDCSGSIIIYPPYHASGRQKGVELKHRCKDCKHLKFTNELLAHLSSPLVEDLSRHLALIDPAHACKAVVNSYSHTCGTRFPSSICPQMHNVRNHGAAQDAR